MPVRQVRALCISFEKGHLSSHCCLQLPRHANNTLEADLELEGCPPHLTVVLQCPEIACTRGQSQGASGLWAPHRYAATFATRLKEQEIAMPSRWLGVEVGTLGSDAESACDARQAGTGLPLP